MELKTFTCCFCKQEWQRGAGYANIKDNYLCYECIVECAAHVICDKGRVRQTVFNKGVGVSDD